jgi:hypothetical protein
MSRFGMTKSRSSSVRAAGLPSPIPVSAAVLRALALRPVDLKHNAKPPQDEGGHNKTKVGFPTTRNLTNTSRHLRTKLEHTAAKSMAAATLAECPLVNRLSAAYRRTHLNKGTLSQTVSERRAA